MSDSETAHTETRDSKTSEKFAAIHNDIGSALQAHQRVNELTVTSPLRLRFWLQKLIRRALAWYTLPIQRFQQAVLTALGHTLDSLRAHEMTLDEHASATRQLRDDVQQLRQGHAALAQEYASFAEKFDLFRRAAQLTSSSKLLRENDPIVEYWNQAAEKDPARETVTQRPDETREEYQENWKKIGAYVADKIMSYSGPNPVALEIGPGMGRITVPMSEYCKSITALDISPVMAARAQEATTLLNNVTIQIITDEDLRFLPSEHFDLAYSVACFQHADKKTFYRYLEGIRRALKPGGVLFFGVLNLCTDLGWGHFEAIVRNDYPEFFHTPDELSAYLQRAGYSSYEFAEEGETLWAIARC
jgi:SAM-dependent methyltransferase